MKSPFNHHAKWQNVQQLPLVLVNAFDPRSSAMSISGIHPMPLDFVVLLVQFASGPLLI